METKRITVRPKNPNMLFKKFLSELIAEAEKNKKRVAQTYQRALDSLNLYPLTLYSGHDCSILENFGPKICQMMDEKLEAHMKGRVDLFQQRGYKEKIIEVQRREALRISDLIRSVEAAGLIDNTFSTSRLQPIEEDNEMNKDESQESLNVNVNRDRVQEMETQEELQGDLLSLSDSEDSLDKLMRKYDPEAAKPKKKLKIDPPPQPSTTSQFNSPVTTQPRGRKFVKHKTFDSSRFAGPSYASSPISTFLDVETGKSPALVVIEEDFEEDEFDRLAAKYDNLSPIPATKRKAASPVKVAKKIATKSVRAHAVASDPVSAFVAPASVEDKEEIEYISVDDINPNEFDIVLLVDIGETLAG